MSMLIRSGVWKWGAENLMVERGFSYFLILLILGYCVVCCLFFPSYLHSFLHILFRSFFFFLIHILSYFFDSFTVSIWFIPLLMFTFFSQLEEAHNDPQLSYLDREVQQAAKRLSLFSSKNTKESKTEKEVHALNIYQQLSSSNFLSFTSSSVTMNILM